MLNNKNEEVKIIGGRNGFKIVDTTGYTYQNSSSIEILGCVFNVDEKELIKVIEDNNNDIIYFDINKNECSNKENYLKYYNDDELYITPFVDFKTYEKAKEVLTWLNSQ